MCVPPGPHGSGHLRATPWHRHPSRVAGRAERGGMWTCKPGPSTSTPKAAHRSGCFSIPCWCACWADSSGVTPLKPTQALTPRLPSTPLRTSRPGQACPVSQPVGQAAGSAAGSTPVRRPVPEGRHCPPHLHPLPSSHLRQPPLPEDRRPVRGPAGARPLAHHDDGGLCAGGGGATEARRCYPGLTGHSGSH